MPPIQPMHLIIDKHVREENVKKESKYIWIWIKNGEQFQYFVIFLM